MSSVTHHRRSNKVIAENQVVWMGIDTHKKNTTVTILDHDEVLYRDTIPTERKHFESIMRRLPQCRVEAVYEAGPTGYQLLRWLEEAGAEVMMTAPSNVPSRRGDYVKTDRRDALKLARMHRGQLLDPIWALTDEQYEHRELVRTRRQMVRKRTQTCQQIRAKLLYHGQTTPEDDQWSNAFLEWLQDAPTGRAGVDIGLASLARVYCDLTREIRALTKQIESLATACYEIEVDILNSIPGVGLITAMTFLTELGAIERFPTAERFVSYLGLTPSESSSGESKRQGGLPRRGNPHVRAVLVQAAWTTIGKDARMREVYDRIKNRNSNYGPQIAIVAVARRLALAMRAMLRDGTLYECEPLEPS